jgi:hypothetical protein
MSMKALELRLGWYRYFYYLFPTCFDLALIQEIFFNEKHVFDVTVTFRSRLTSWYHHSTALVHVDGISRHKTFKTRLESIDLESFYCNN